MFIKFDAECFNYHGRWERVENGCKSHWTRPYVEFFCDADFSLKLREGSGEYSVFVGGEKAEAVGGVYKLSKKSLVRLTADQTNVTVTFEGIETEGDVGYAPSRKQNILFIGDSLTHSPVSHSVIIPKEFDCDYTCIAQGGMSLCVDRGYVTVPEGHLPYKGMSAAFFCLQNPCEEGEMVPFDFSTDAKYDKIVILIGTNDHLTDESYVDGFAVAYREFVKKIIDIYGNIPVFLALPSADTVGSDIGWRRNTIEACAKEAEALYSNVTYISSRDWDVEISSDSVHPTTEGYAVYAYELMKHMK